MTFNYQKEISFRGLCIFVAVALTGCQKSEVEETGASAPQFVSMSVGDSHVCWLGGDGLVECNGDGFLGETSSPSTEFIQIDGGLHHSCGVTQDSTVECWGFNGFEQLDASKADLSGVSAGGYHTCAIDGAGEISCWGGIRDGEANPPAGEFISVAGGEGHTCAVNTLGAVECWGLDDNGQSSPDVGEFLSVSSGWTHSCGLSTDGDAICWGSNFDGESSPPEGTFVDVRAGKYFSCGLRDNGELACWGKDASGQATPPEGTHLALDVGGEFACALEFGGDPVCWGNVPDEVLPQAIISDGFSVEGVAWNFGKYDWAEAEMCLTLVDPSSVLTGGEQEILGETLIRSAGAFSVSGVETDSTLGLFMVVQDCQGVGDVVPTATGIGYAEFEGLTTGDTVMRRQTLVIDRELAGLIDSEVEGEIDLADGIEVQGAMFGFVRDTTGQFIDGATIVCDAMECPTVFYFDSDHSDGMFSTGGQLNQHADAAAESAFIIPKAPLQTYVAQLDGVQFRPEFFGSSPGSVTVIVFVGEP